MGVPVIRLIICVWGWRNPRGGENLHRSACDLHCNGRLWACVLFVCSFARLRKPSRSLLKLWIFVKVQGLGTSAPTGPRFSLQWAFVGVRVIRLIICASEAREIPGVERIGTDLPRVFAICVCGCTIYSFAHLRVWGLWNPRGGEGRHRPAHDFHCNRRLWVYVVFVWWFAHLRFVKSQGWMGWALIGSGFCLRSAFVCVCVLFICSCACLRKLSRSLPGLWIFVKVQGWGGSAPTVPTFPLQWAFVGVRIIRLIICTSEAGEIIGGEDRHRPAQGFIAIGYCWCTCYSFAHLRVGGIVDLDLLEEKCFRVNVIIESTMTDKDVLVSQYIYIYVYIGAHIKSEHHTISQQKTHHDRCYFNSGYGSVERENASESASS